MLNVLASQKDKTQRQIRSFINGLFIPLLELLSLLCFKTLKLYNCLVRSCTYPFNKLY